MQETRPSFAVIRTYQRSAWKSVRKIPKTEKWYRCSEAARQ